MEEQQPYRSVDRAGSAAGNNQFDEYNPTVSAADAIHAPSRLSSTGLRAADTKESQVEHALLAALFIVVTAIVIFAVAQSIPAMSAANNLIGGSVLLPLFGGNGLAEKIPNVREVIALLPIASVAVCLLTVGVVYLARESKSREIDWTDTHLFLEYSGPLTLALKWSAITSVTQGIRYDILNGRQPVFVVKTAEGNVFKLKQADICQKHDMGAFFSLLKTNSPHAELNVDQSFASNNSYTELWLKYFSTPAERRKTGLLESEMMLDEGRYKVVGTVGGGGQGTAYLAVVQQPVEPALSKAKAKSEKSDENQEKREFLPLTLMTVTDGEDKDGDEDEEPGTRHIIEISEREVLPVAAQVVLKEYVLPIHRGHLTAERTEEKLKAEAEILRRLDHPQIVKLADAFIEDFRGYLVLEYVVGETLKARVERLGPARESEVIEWVAQVCSILEYLHGLSPPVVHRDITPDNLMLQEDGMIKLVDFNVAHQVDSSSTATVVGKHAYIPAEQFRGKPTPQSDIYALGGTAYFLLTGKEPEPITVSRPKRVRESVSQQLDDIVARCTAASLKDRMATASELKMALSSARTQAV